jgi:hypothetical protein
MDVERRNGNRNGKESRWIVGHINICRDEMNDELEKRDEVKIKKMKSYDKKKNISTKK